MAVLKKLMAYALCDSLGIKLTYDPADNSLRGASEHVVNASGLRFTVASEVVSSWLAATVHVVIVKCVGNLALLAVGKPTNACSDVDLHLLNLAKMDQAAGLAGEGEAGLAGGGDEAPRQGDRRQLPQDQFEQVGRNLTAASCTGGLRGTAVLDGV